MFDQSLYSKTTVPTSDKVGISDSAKLVGSVLAKSGAFDPEPATPVATAPAVEAPGAPRNQRARRRRPPGLGDEPATPVATAPAVEKPTTQRLKGKVSKPPYWPKLTRFEKETWLMSQFPKLEPSNVDRIMYNAQTEIISITLYVTGAILDIGCPTVSTKPSAKQVAEPSAKKGAKQVTDPSAKKGAKQVAEPSAKKGDKQVTEPSAKKGAKQVTDPSAKKGAKKGANRFAAFETELDKQEQEDAKAEAMRGRKQLPKQKLLRRQRQKLRLSLLGTPRSR